MEYKCECTQAEIEWQNAITSMQEKTLACRTILMRDVAERQPSPRLGRLLYFGVGLENLFCFHSHLIVIPRWHRD